MRASHTNTHTQTHTHTHMRARARVVLKARKAIKACTANNITKLTLSITRCPSSPPQVQAVHHPHPLPQHRLLRPRLRQVRPHHGFDNDVGPTAPCLAGCPSPWMKRPLSGISTLPPRPSPSCGLRSVCVLPTRPRPQPHNLLIHTLTHTTCVHPRPFPPGSTPLRAPSSAAPQSWLMSTRARAATAGCCSASGRCAPPHSTANGTQAGGASDGGRGRPGVRQPQLLGRGAGGACGAPF
jgi:hypothetical protein